MNINVEQVFFVSAKCILNSFKQIFIPKQMELKGYTWSQFKATFKMKEMKPINFYAQFWQLTPRSLHNFRQPAYGKNHPPDYTIHHYMSNRFN